MDCQDAYAVKNMQMFANKEIPVCYRQRQCDFRLKQDLWRNGCHDIRRLFLVKYPHILTGLSCKCSACTRNITYVSDTQTFLAKGHKQYR